MQRSVGVVSAGCYIAGRDVLLVRCGGRQRKSYEGVVYSELTAGILPSSLLGFRAFTVSSLLTGSMELCQQHAKKP